MLLSGRLLSGEWRWDGVRRITEGLDPRWIKNMPRVSVVDRGRGRTHLKR